MKQHFEFDSLKHSVSMGENTAVLNPLSFKLLKLLFDADGEVVSVNDIMKRVWENKQVSPESLKQRVFILRKALTDKGIEGVEIQSIRGEGYRLIIENKPQSFTSTFLDRQRNFWAFGAVMSLIIVVFLYFLFSAPRSSYFNNRVALWTNIESSDFDTFESSVYQRWHQLLSEEMQANKLNFVLSKKQDDVLVSVQSRKDRIAVISYFQVLPDENTPIVNLSLVEPRTATVLRNDRLEVSADREIDSVLYSQLQGIHELINSGKLNLTKTQKENANDPVWLQLKALANSK